MSEPVAQSRTTTLPFYRVSCDLEAPQLFQVNPDVDLADALDRASLFLAAAYDMADDLSTADGSGNDVYAMVVMIELAKSVIDSLSMGLMRSEVAA